MDAITKFQESLAEPVSGVLGTYWPFLLVIAIAFVAWFLNPRWRDASGADINMSLEGDRDADGNSGDGGGGDGGGGD